MKPLALIATLALIASPALAEPRPISCVDTSIDNPPIDKASSAQCSPRPDGGQTCRSYWLNSGNLASESQRDAQGREQGISKTYYSNGSLKTTTAAPAAQQWTHPSKATPAPEASAPASK